MQIPRITKPIKVVMRKYEMVFAVLFFLPVMSVLAGEWTYNSGGATLSHDTSDWVLYVSRNGTDLTVTGISQSPPYFYYYPCALPLSDPIPGYALVDIGDWAFSNSYMTSVTIPSSVTNIGDYAFSGCGHLTSVTIPDNVISIGDCAFYGCLSLTSTIIPDGVTFIGDEAFHSCIRMTNIAIPASVTTIGSYAFFECSALTAINVNPGSLAYASMDGILYNKSMTALIQCPGGKTGDVTIPASVTSIGEFAFHDSTGLTAINASPISASYISVDGILYNKIQDILVKCPRGKIGGVTISASVTSIDSYAFYGCTGLTSVTIPASVTSIGHDAFNGCTGLTSITIPSGITSIYGSTFYFCTGLTSITIPSSVTLIGQSAFSRCLSLTNVTIPSSVNNISGHAFYGCSALASALFTGNVPYYIGSYAFNSTPSTLYYLPGSSGWSDMVAGRPAVCWNPSFDPTSPPCFNSGTFGITFTGNTNIPVKVEATTNLSSQIWITVTNATLNSTGSLFITDPSSSSLPSRFYRIVWP